MAERYALVAVESTVYSFDKAFSYRVPDALLEQTQPGCRVLVSFGRGNKKCIGMVLALTEQAEHESCKPIAAVLDQAPLLQSELLQLAAFLSEQTFCTLYEAVRAMLPPGINQKLVRSFAAIAPGDVRDTQPLTAQEQELYDYLLKRGGYVKKESLYKALGYAQDAPFLDTLLTKGRLYSNSDAVNGVQEASTRMVRLNEDAPAVTLTKKQQEVIDLLHDIGSASVKEICYFTGLTPAVTLALEKKGVVTVYQQLRVRRPKAEFDAQAEQCEILLTPEQQACYENLFKQYETGGGSSLLFGVTGAGKTQVYLRLIDEICARGKTAIVMVPEIALTPQMLSLFYRRYGTLVAVVHSALSAGERADEWRRMRGGDARIVLGTRSAIFAPVENLGLIIMDEEQEHTYKSEQTPRYTVKDVARFRGAYHKALTVYASATPSVESFAAAKAGKYSLNTLKSRYGSAVLPEVVTVDMKQEQQLPGQSPALSSVLLQALEHTLAEGHQAILLINRRGFNTFCACRACDHVISCPYCSVSMTYHTANNRLMCHYCGFSREFSNLCDSCGKPQVRYAGFGTQRIETELEQLLPDARILRMDMDTTSGRYAHESKLEQFRKQEFDILLGTQMVAKGLDFENVTLVGVISVDQQLYNGDFRSLEQTFSLLTQVVGRSGRGKYPGKALIQTLTPENPIIQLAAKQDYEAFFNTEIRIRKQMIYPPYCDLCVIGFACEQEDRARAAAHYALDRLSALNAADYPEQKLIILGPMPARIAKVSNKYRFRLIIKCKNTAGLRRMIAALLKELGSQSSLNGITIYADMNPKEAI